VTKPLIIVESPTKVKTIKKYIGDQFDVAATSGHLRDLPPKEIGIDIEGGFIPQYVNIEGKAGIIKKLKGAARGVRDIYLAPDPDREGEAIAYHTAEILKKKDTHFHRVLFHELTRNGIRDAIAHPHALNHHRFEAQQARRILDRLVGYQISPLLWRKVLRGLSAGRVQSVAVRIICEREKAIQAFEPQEYWSITARLQADTPPDFSAKLSHQDGKKIHIPDEAHARQILEALQHSPFRVDTVKHKTIKRNPLPPFITSKLQQEAINKLKFSAKKTMAVAQALYEGIELAPGEPVGLITYMRTDSTRIAREAALEALDLIRQTFGEEYVIDKPRFFKNKNKAQDAHEAIRPTSVSNTPEKVAPFLSKDQLALYTLIWKRFVASQMCQALIDQNSIAIKADKYTFSVSGSTVKFPGFMALYMSEDDKKKSDKDKQEMPKLTEGMLLTLLKLEPKQHFTTPPPRFSEASLVKELEENGIGRPSTYASILSTIRDKGYVERVKRYFKPSELGLIVNDLLVENFPKVLDVAFTAKMEHDLDRVETAEAKAVDILNDFYQPFHERLEDAREKMLNIKGVGMPTGLKCPRCGKELHIKVGKNGPFLACEGYPECSYSSNYERDEKGRIHPVASATDQETDKTCPKCGSPMVIKQGRYGEFLACSGYPQCKHTESLTSGKTGARIGVQCPETDCDGEIVERRSKRGKIFYGCSRYPDCKFASWNKPVAEACPECDSPYLIEKTTKKDGTFIACPNRECCYKRKIED
jgi:DNA topoisomerase-1